MELIVAQSRIAPSFMEPADLVFTRTATGHSHETDEASLCSLSLRIILVLFSDLHLSFMSIKYAVPCIYLHCLLVMLSFVIDELHLC